MSHITALMLAISLLCIVIGFLAMPRYELFLTALISAIVFGIVSPLITARRLFFLAVESTHMALLAASLSIVLLNTTQIGNEFLWATVVGLAIIYAIGFAIHKSYDPDIVTSIATAATVSGSVMAMYIVLTRYSVGYSLWSIILGDPLLITWRDIAILAPVSAIIVVISLAVYKVVIYIGVDRDGARLVFRHIYLYDLLFFTALALTAIVLLKVVGYVVEHVLLLLPAIAAMNMVEGGRNIMLASICLSVISSMVGFTTSLFTGIAPASAVGFIMLAIYILSLAVKKVWRYG